MKLLKVCEVAALFGVSAWYVREHDVDLGLTPLRTVGGQRRYRLAEVLAGLRRQSHVDKKEAIKL